MLKCSGWMPKYSERLLMCFYEPVIVFWRFPMWFHIELACFINHRSDHIQKINWVLTTSNSWGCVNYHFVLFVDQKRFEFDVFVGQLKPYAVDCKTSIYRKKTADSNHGLWLNYLKQCHINIHKTSQMNTWIWHLINIQHHMHINKTMHINLETVSIFMRTTPGRW